jgi:hypothetical protein
LVIHDGNAIVVPRSACLAGLKKTLLHTNGVDVSKMDIIAILILSCLLQNDVQASGYTITGVRVFGNTPHSAPSVTRTRRLLSAAMPCMDACWRVDADSSDGGFKQHPIDSYSSSTISNDRMARIVVQHRPRSEYYDVRQACFGMTNWVPVWDVRI